MSPGGITHLDYTVILCSHLEETRAFYTGIMGFAVAEDRPNWVSFRLGATLLTLRPRGTWSVCDDGPLPPGTAAVQLAFRVPLDAIDAWHNTLVERGVPILRPPTDLPHWRHRTLFFRDPEDNILELYAEY
ncbi:glyoxalase/bleomycin resistance/dioxygenase family protein [Roseomonas stagni]|uniref:Glyoxalase/bleomycin resistance/dioxygenase family protein n=1 Tax=Falsiroseomonas algicola TaxID=2716930 RepID=A0A6M1LFJ0_9PROT|nr:VOC family protein [Falsiroseomonas algicola]NGM18947.1 glyoxalase/bleomycin resistance/dioxygenase family protein [Falsiroseomonas algicola]